MAPCSRRAQSGTARLKYKNGLTFAPFRTVWFFFEPANHVLASVSAPNPTDDAPGNRVAGCSVAVDLFVRLEAATSPACAPYGQTHGGASVVVLRLLLVTLPSLVVRNELFLSIHPLGASSPSSGDGSGAP